MPSQEPTPGRRPGKLAAGIAAAAPPIAVLTVAASLFLPPWNEMPKPAATWLLLAVVAGCGAAASVLLWRGIRRGSSPAPLLALATAPWLISFPFAWAETRAAIEMMAAGAPMEVLLATTPATRVVGLLATWALAGSVAFALAIAALAGRAGSPRARDILIGLASLVPLIGYVAWHAATGELTPLWIDAGLLGLVLWAAPIDIGLASASPPSRGALAPADRWRIAVGLAVALGFCAAASLYVSVARLQASQVFLSAPADAASSFLGTIRAELDAASRFRWIGTAIALLPAVVLTLAGAARKAAAAAVAGAAAILAGVLVLDASVSTVRTPMGGLDEMLDAYADHLDNRAVAEGPGTGPREGPGGPAETAVVPAPPSEIPAAMVPEGVPGGVVGGVEGGVPGGKVGEAVPTDAELAPAVVIHRATPQLPVGALPPGERRMVIVRVEVGADGAVTGATVVRSASRALDDAAIEAARRSRFRPATRDGVPVASTELMTYQFVSD